MHLSFCLHTGMCFSFSTAVQAVHGAYVPLMFPFSDYIYCIRSTCDPVYFWVSQKLEGRKTQVLEDMKQIASPDRSYKNYKEKLRSIIPPCIPFVGESNTCNIGYYVRIELDG